MDQPADILSPVARELVALDFRTAYTRLVVSGDGNPAAKKQLDGLTPADLFIPMSGKSADDQKAALSGLWLWHDWLDQSHTLSQSLDNKTGSFWHAILHRREGDFSNSKYWYARAEGHPAVQVLANQAGSVVNQMPADKLLFRIVANGWDPRALVDLVQEVHDDPSDARHSAAVSLQQLEWRVLFDHCTRK